MPLAPATHLSQNLHQQPFILTRHIPSTNPPSIHFDITLPFPPQPQPYHGIRCRWWTSLCEMQNNKNLPQFLLVVTPLLEKDRCSSLSVNSHRRNFGQPQRPLCVGKRNDADFQHTSDRENPCWPSCHIPYISNLTQLTGHNAVIWPQTLPSKPTFLQTE